MLKVGRNDTCPCGSGKKYKKCCEKKEVVPITSIVDNELMQIQQDIFGFAMSHYQEEMEEILYEEYEGVDFPHEDLENVFMITGFTWGIFTVPVKGNKRIIDLFITQNQTKISRPSTREVVRSWANGKPTISLLVDNHGHEMLVEDIFTGEKKVVHILNPDLADVEPGSILFGILLPLGDKFAYFIDCIDYSYDLDETIFMLQDSYEESEIFELDEFLSIHFLSLLVETILTENIDLKIDIDQIDWASDSYKLVAENFEFYMEGRPEHFVPLGISIWKTYTDRKKPTIKNPNIAIAALHYLLDNLFIESYTQKSIAELYGVTTGSVSNRYRDIFDTVEDVIDAIYREIIAPERDAAIQRRIEANEKEIARLEAEMANYSRQIEEAKQNEKQKSASKKTPKKPSLQNKGKAQDLIYQAINADSPLRANLAKQAMELDPYNPDAYNILSEEAASLSESMKLAKQGMEMGAIELGDSFFKENQGYFWGLIETRPFMRAKHNYAGFLMENGQLQEAIKQYEELLGLNPMDNQGVRYELIEAYLLSNETQKALALLKEYPEESTHNMYNLVLVEYLEHGNTVKLKKRIKEAKKQNPHVGDYLRRKKPIPMFLPKSYGFGDKDEAILYADNFIQYWEKNPDLLELLK
jgi:tetratricopeptide (TPR) repeat protein